MRTRELELFRSMHNASRRIAVLLNRRREDCPTEIALSLDMALRKSRELEKWLEEIVYLAETELVRPVGRPNT